VRDLLPWALSCALSAALGGVVALMLWRLRRSRKGRRVQAHGKRGEELAEALLRAEGFTIVERQRRLSYVLSEAEAPRAIEVVVDFVVRKGGQELVAEVKTGPTAVLRSAETRRQLLEYQLASGAGAVLLVDADGGKISRVTFPLARPEVPDSAGRSGRILVMLGLCLLLMAASYLYGRAG
jgi:hypothetical protein